MEVKLWTTKTESSPTPDFLLVNEDDVIPEAHTLQPVLDRTRLTVLETQKHFWNWTQMKYCFNSW